MTTDGPESAPRRNGGASALRAPGGWAPGKVKSLTEALSVVRDGDLVALGGMTLYRRPVAAAAELIRLRRRGLTLLDYVGGFEGDILIGAGCVDQVRSCYFGLDVLGLAPMHRRASQEGRLKVLEETEVTVALGLRATRGGVDFMPARIFAGTEMPSIRPDLRSVESPFSGQEYVAVPAIAPDVAIVHALMADEAGNAILGGEYNLDLDLAAAARRTILTTERVASRSEIEAQGADILAGWVDDVVATPRGAYPTSCFPLYDVDLEFLADYVEACRAGSFESFIGDRVLNGA